MLSLCRRRARSEVRQQLERRARVSLYGPRLIRQHGGARHACDRCDDQLADYRPRLPRRHQLQLLGRAGGRALLAHPRKAGSFSGTAHQQEPE